MASEKHVAIVTGGAQGLGYSIVAELLEAGFKVCMSDINEENGKIQTQGLKEKYGDSNIIFHVCDVAQRSHYIDVCEYVLKEFKRIDILVNNAGIMNDVNPKKMIDINLVGPIYGCEMALKYMAKDKGGNGGIVINVSSIAGLIPFQATPAYAATKHGVVGLTRSFGTDYHYIKSGVIFCALCPFFINTELLSNLESVYRDPTVDVTQRDDLMEPSYVAKAAMKLIQDRKNGGVLLVTEEKCTGYKYMDLLTLKGLIK